MLPWFSNSNGVLHGPASIKHLPHFKPFEYLCQNPNCEQECKWMLADKECHQESEIYQSESRLNQLVSKRGDYLPSAVPCHSCGEFAVYGCCSSCGVRSVYSLSHCDFRQGFRCDNCAESSDEVLQRLAGIEATVAAMPGIAKSVRRTKTLKAQIASLDQQLKGIAESSSVLAGVETRLAQMLGKEGASLERQLGRKITEGIERLSRDSEKSADKRTNDSEIFARAQTLQIEDKIKCLDKRVESLQERFMKMEHNPILDQQMIPYTDSEGKPSIPAGSSWWSIVQIFARYANKGAVTTQLNELRLAALGGNEPGRSSLDDNGRHTWHSIPDGIGSEFRDLKTWLSHQLAELRSAAQEVEAKPSGKEWLSEQFKELKGGGWKFTGRSRTGDSDSTHETPATPAELSAVLHEFLCFHKPEIKQLVAELELGPAVKLVTDLPALFNFVEDQLRRRQSQTGGGEADAESVLLDEFKKRFYSWQDSHHITRVQQNASGEEFDRRYHFPSQTEITTEPGLHRRIKEVLHDGYVFRGSDKEIVLQKAEVVVWNCPNA